MNPIFLQNRQPIPISVLLSCDVRPWRKMQEIQLSKCSGDLLLQMFFLQHWISLDWNIVLTCV